jgi:hypothetical protein
MKTQITREMLPKIKAPKFKVASKYILNEYELRYLMLETARGNIQSGLSVVDMQSKQKGFIRDDGAISTSIGNSLRMNGEFMVELSEISNRKIRETHKLLELHNLNKRDTIKLEGLETITKYALATIEIKNQKRKI